MAKKSSTKKKGPKGKKARAQAKLEKRWGEHVDEEALQKSKIRKGKSRLKSKHPSNERRAAAARDQERTAAAAENWTSEEDASDSDEEEELQSGAFSSLLQSINKKSKKSRKLSANDLGEDMEVEDNETDEDQEGDATDASNDEELSEEDGMSESRESDEVEPEQSTDDPFTTHFCRDTLPEDEGAISALLKEAQSTIKVETPSVEESLDFQLSARLVESLGVKQEQHSGRSQEMWMRSASSLFEYNRKVLKENWKRANRSAVKKNSEGLVSVGRGGGPQLSNLQSIMYPALASYADILVSTETLDNRDTFSNLISLHILNHVLTARGRVQRNNKRAKDAEANDDEAVDEASLRDQGYTRPTVLILLPTRGICYTFVNSMLALLGDAATVENVDRFDAEFGPVDDDDDAENNVLKHRRKVNAAKGGEWNEVFGDEANSDDDFKIGLSFSTKAVKQTDSGNKSGVGVRLYTDFYKSDIIVASPLGLKMATSSEEEEEDTDYLSSIEICYVGSSDILMMQNWDHVASSFERLNLQPKKNNNTDFSRVREYLLAGQAKYWRQLIICSKFIDPCMLSTFKRNACSTAGVLKVRRRLPVNEAGLVDVVVATKQVFQRIPCKSFVTQGHDRLDYFEKQVLPQIQRTRQKHTLIYTPSYFEFISLRNLLLKKEMSFVSVTEYARVSEVSRGRARFLQGRKSIMLYTGRAHFFSRHTIKGAKHLIFYGLPEHSEFYPGIVNMLNLGISDDEIINTGSSCLALFTKYEAHALERICGRQNGDRMVKGEKSTFMFVS